VKVLLQSTTTAVSKAASSVADMDREKLTELFDAATSGARKDKKKQDELRKEFSETLKASPAATTFSSPSSPKSKTPTSPKSSPKNSPKTKAPTSPEMKSKMRGSTDDTLVLPQSLPEPEDAKEAGGTNRLQNFAAEPYIDEDDDGEGSWFDGHMSVSDEALPGCAAFAKAAQKKQSSATDLKNSSVFKNQFTSDSEHEEGEEDDHPNEPNAATKGLGFLTSNLGGWEHEKKGEDGPLYGNIHKGCNIRLLTVQSEINPDEKQISLGQLHDIMLGCVKGKAEDDAQHKKLGQSCITLESFLFDFLQERYNSSDPGEIKDWFHTLSKGINKYGLFNSEFAIFGKMLKNQLPESFPGMQRVLEGCAEKHLKKEIGEADFAYRDYRPIPLQAFDKVANQLFAPKDAAEIMRRVKDPVPKAGKRYAASMEALSRGGVNWRIGLEIIRTFNMNLQEDFLADFITEFRNLDRMHDGTLVQADLQQLVNKYGTLEGVQDGSSQHFTMLADAKASTLRAIRKHRRMTFSEAAVAFVELQQARWSISGKKGIRYQYHDKLKAYFCELAAEREKARKLAAAKKHKANRQKTRATDTGVKSPKDGQGDKSPTKTKTPKTAVFVEGS